jgi:hypothetical protein
MESAVERALRTRIISWVQERAEANGGFLHRAELLDFRIDEQKLPIIDYSRGIRNPASFESTLSIVSATNGLTTTLNRKMACSTTRTAKAIRGRETIENCGTR